MVGEAEKIYVFRPDKNFEILVIIIKVVMFQFIAKSLIFKGKITKEFIYSQRERAGLFCMQE